MVGKADGIHCRECGRPFTPENPRYYTRQVCWDCGLDYQRQKSRALRQIIEHGVYARGKRTSDSGDLKKICGRARFLRERRIARYAHCVVSGAPIEYEPRGGV
jgi:predicted nucleic acid-binding Zn ribbon protein